METFLSIVVWLTRQHIVVILILTLVINLLPWVKHWLFAAVIAILLYSTIVSNLLFMIRVPIIDAYGVLTKGTVLSQSRMPVVHNYEKLFRRHVAYTLADGTLQESSFISITADAAPMFGVLNRPQVGQNFDLKYLPMFPHYFILYETEQTRQCRELSKQIRELNQKIELAPHNNELPKERSRLGQEWLRQCRQSG